MPGVLLDSHVLYWLASGEEVLSDQALAAIADAAAKRMLYVSPITAWELAIASKKPARRSPPDLGAGTPAAWFTAAVAATGARIIPIHHRIACAAAMVASEMDHHDPGDCYLIATARVRKIPLVTRDTIIRRIAASGYLNVVVC